MLPEAHTHITRPPPKYCKPTPTATVRTNRPTCTCSTRDRVLRIRKVYTNKREYIHICYVA